MGLRSESVAVHIREMRGSSRSCMRRRLRDGVAHDPSRKRGEEGPLFVPSGRMGNAAALTTRAH